MLVVRDVQMEVLRRYAREAFEIRLARNLVSVFPERFSDAGAAATVDFAQASIETALRNGITTEHSIATFANLRATFGVEFEWTPVAADALELLHDAFLPGPIKVAAMRDCLYASTGGRAITLVLDRQG